jgi:dTDP-4-dehydrorhamnose 3,5-epimerase-like enzyme
MSFRDVPELIEGGISVDDRGQLAFCNAEVLRSIRRFYAVANHRQGTVRAWHAHRREVKMIWPLAGAALIGAVKIDDWDRPSPALTVERFVLAAARPALLVIPAGYANGFMSLTPDTNLLFLSTSTLDESRGDDVRFDARYWDPWHVTER